MKNAASVGDSTRTVIRGLTQSGVMTDGPGVLTRVDGGGLVVAVVGFLLSRFAVLESASPRAMVPSFLVGEGLSMVLGLGLSVAGVALAVSSHSTRYVNTVAKWCVLGLAGAGLLIGSVLLNTRMAESSVAMTGGVPARTLVGGAIAGVAIGASSARADRGRREIRAYADRLTVLNRILRHEVLNKVNVIQGYAGLSEDRGDVIGRNARAIDDAIDEVGFLTTGETTTGSVDLRAAVADALTEVHECFPAAEVTVEEPPDGIEVRANERLTTLLVHLLANAAEYGGGGRLSTATTVERVAITVADDGPGLPAEAEAVLTDRSLPEYDDPGHGFGLTVVRLLVEEFDGEVRVETGAESGTAITVSLPRSDGATRDRSRVGVHPERLAIVGVGGIGAGLVMGVAMNTVTDVVTVIGALYGTPAPVVGWVTHLFHSVVFAVAFAALLRGSGVLHSWRHRRRSLALGVGFGTVLWLVAAGVVMPLWLRAAGLNAALPNLSLVGLGGHVLWGVVVGAWVGALGE